MVKAKQPKATKQPKAAKAELRPTIDYTLLKEAIDATNVAMVKFDVAGLAKFGSVARKLLDRARKIDENRNAAATKATDKLKAKFTKLAEEAKAVGIDIGSLIGQNS